MSEKKDFVTRKEIDRCLRYVSGNNKSEQGRLLKLLQEIRISLAEPIVEDSIDGTSIHVTYTTAISRKGVELAESVIRFQYMKEILVDYNKVPIRLRDNNTTAPASTVDQTITRNDKATGE